VAAPSPRPWMTVAAPDAEHAESTVNEDKPGYGGPYAA
jgi:hypothetical protein